jgi:hypothetical protein
MGRQTVGAFGPGQGRPKVFSPVGIVGTPPDGLSQRFCGRVIVNCARGAKKFHLLSISN